MCATSTSLHGFFTTHTPENNAHTRLCASCCLCVDLQPIVAKDRSQRSLIELEVVVRDKFVLALFGARSQWMDERLLFF